jgi:hypothetical protein
MFLTSPTPPYLAPPKRLRKGEERRGNSNRCRGSRLGDNFYD